MHDSWYSLTTDQSQGLMPPNLDNSILFYFLYILLKDFIYLFIFRDTGREGKEREKHRPVASHMPPTGDLACSPDMYPDRELN